MSMAKTSASVSVPLFGQTVPLETKEPRKTVLVSVSRDPYGKSVTEHLVVEDAMKNQIALDYRESLLSTLVDKGINPHSLNMVEVSKLGVDRSVDDVANYIIDHAQDYFVTSSKFDEK